MRGKVCPALYLLPEFCFLLLYVSPTPLPPPPPLLCANRLRRENTKRATQGKPLLKAGTKEAKAFLMEEVLLGVEYLGEAEEVELFKKCRKGERQYFKAVRQDKQNQIEEDLKRQRGKVQQQEAKELKALTKFKDRENYIVYHSMIDLEEELEATLGSGKPKYSLAMKIEIVEKQLQYRRDCYARTLRPGALVSHISTANQLKLDKLLDNFQDVLDDEANFPALAAPPTIRQVFQAHPFANPVRAGLETVRNACTREMTRHFCETYEGGEFTAWRANVDYSLARPSNPEAIIGQTVGRNFDEGYFEGKVASYKKPWWKIEYNDGDKQEVTYRELCKFKKPPDFSVFRYPAPDEQAKSFLKESGGKMEFKAGSPGKWTEFKLEGCKWTLVQVYLVGETKNPLQGAYIESDDFYFGMRDMDLATLRAKHPEARLSPIQEIVAWIDASPSARSARRESSLL